ncbi:MAG: TerC family protein [Planctomycetes bacterium]|nr:TerC family protein [Planctomycetota bacterium]
MTWEFWEGLAKIIGIDILLSGDNAVVIALACRSLPPAQQRKGIIIGAGAAIGLRVVFASVITLVLEIPYLKLAGGLLLFHIAIKLLKPEDSREGHDVDAASNLWQAIRTVAIADAVMSLDNVIAIGAAAHGDVLLIVLGLLFSIPLIIYGSTLILKLLARYPIIVTAGGGLLGWIAGEITVGDDSIAGYLKESGIPHYERIAAAAGALFVIAIGTWLGRRVRRRRAPRRDDLAPKEKQ